MQEYGIFTEDLYKELDRIWIDLCMKYRRNPFLLVLMNPYFMVKEKWKSYKRKALHLFLFNLCNRTALG